MEVPFISVIITTYNRRELLPYAIQSVLNQTYTNYEIIVINDCGEDVWDIIESFNSNKIKYLSHIINSGLPFARNTAIQESRGEILCYLDDDDMFLPEHLATVSNVFKSPKVKVAYVDSYYVEEEIVEGERIELERSRPYAEINYSWSRLMVTNFIPVNAWVHRASLFRKLDCFDESLTTNEDWDMLIRLAKDNEVVQIHKPTVEVRHRKHVSDNMLFREADKYDTIKKIYEKNPTNDFDILKKRQLKLYFWATARKKSFKIFKIYALVLHKFNYQVLSLKEIFLQK